MGFLEFFGDNREENIGKVGIKAPERDEEPNGLTAFKFGLSALILVLVEAALIGSGSGAAVPVDIVLVIYLLIAYFVKSEPNTGDMGIAGGLIDHPFKYTDDINRSLFWLKIALAPGRFISGSIVNFARMLAGRRGKR
jgi:hypothetical protein